VSMLKEGGVVSIDGQFTPIDAQSICLHGDTEGALAMAAAIREALIQEGIQIRSFCEGT